MNKVKKTANLIHIDLIKPAGGKIRIM